MVVGLSLRCPDHDTMCSFLVIFRTITDLAKKKKKKSGRRSQRLIFIRSLNGSLWSLRFLVEWRFNRSAAVFFFSPLEALGVLLRTVRKRVSSLSIKILDWSFDQIRHLSFLRAASAQC